MLRMLAIMAVAVFLSGCVSSYGSSEKFRKKFRALIEEKDCVALAKMAAPPGPEYQFGWDLYKNQHAPRFSPYTAYVIRTCGRFEDYVHFRYATFDLGHLQRYRSIDEKHIIRRRTAITNMYELMEDVEKSQVDDEILRGSRLNLVHVFLLLPEVFELEIENKPPTWELSSYFRMDRYNLVDWGKVLSTVKTVAQEQGIRFEMDRFLLIYGSESLGPLKRLEHIKIYNYKPLWLQACGHVALVGGAAPDGGCKFKTSNKSGASMCILEPGQKVLKYQPTPQSDADSVVKNLKAGEVYLTRTNVGNLSSQQTGNVTIQKGTWNLEIDRIDFPEIRAQQGRMKELDCKNPPEIPFAYSNGPMLREFSKLPEFYSPRRDFFRSSEFADYLKNYLKEKYL